MLTVDEEGEVPAPAARVPHPAALNVTVTSHPAVLSEGLTASRKAEFFLFNGKIDAKCCTEHLLFEDLQEKMDTRQFPSSGLCSWKKKKKKERDTQNDFMQREKKKDREKQKC